MKELFQSYKKEYPNELSLLIEVLKADEHARISQYLENKQVDESYLLQLILRHKIIGYVYKILSPYLGEQTKEQITRQYREHSHHTLKFTRQLILVSQKLDEWNLPYIAFKGPVLSQMLYKDPLVKHSVDLDFWVPLEHIEKCHETLSEAGFVRVKPGISLTPKQKKKNYSISHHYTYVRKDEKVVIELHWNITNPYSLLPLSFDEAYHSSMEVDLNGHKINTLSNKYYLLYLAVHGSVHKWARLTWLKDFGTLLKQSNYQQQQEVFRLAKNFQLTKPVNQAFLLASAIFDVAVDESLIKKDRFSNSSFYTTPLKSMLKTSNRSNLEKIPALFYKWHIRDSWVYRFSLLFRLRTHFTDWETVRLPDNLFFLYYLLRPFLFFYRNLCGGRK
ncbi:MAG: nucleotidyltransferase family protein [Bacteroidales bacterium]